jgi:hypothetical protein
MRVVPGTFLGIGENLVGGLNLGEFSRRILDISIVSIGMQLESLFSVRLLDPKERKREGGRSAFHGSLATCESVFTHKSKRQGRVRTHRR